MEWTELSVDQRWHYRNRKWNTERTLQRRASLRAWLNEKKSEQSCAHCGESDPACLDFHHREPEIKEMAVGTMVTYGFGKDTLREELEKCDVLCANCHRKEHERETGTGDSGSVESWVREYKRSSGGCRRCETGDPDCLVFHHPGEKGETVATLVANGRPLREVQSEVERCVVLCSNCHRKEHFEPPQAAE
jgi:5-methylcytosine-specific restriction endonuclease McrA